LLESDKWDYLIFGHEVGENETYHWQGYIQLKSRLTLNQVKKFLPRAHLEQVKGTQQQAIDYCKKGIQSKDEWKALGINGPNYGVDASFDEYGTLRKHGGKNKTSGNYAIIKEKIIKEGVSLRDVVLNECDNPSQIHYAQFMEKYNGLEKDLHDVSVFWYYGPTSCGKSHIVFEAINKDSYWKSSNDLKWFDGYCGQEDVWIDDFRGSHCSFSFLLQLLDKWPLMVPVKGSFVRWSPKRIFITCPYKPQDCYAGVEDKSQLIRRITLIQHFNIRYNPDGNEEVVDEEMPDPEVPLDPESDPNYAYLQGL